MQTHTNPARVVAAASLLTPDLDIAAAFLSGIDPDASVFTFSTFADAKCARAITGTKAASLMDAAPWLIAANRSGAGVFVTVNAMDVSGERKLANFQCVRAVWAELDDGMPSAAWPLEPSIIVESSPGKFHVYWLVSDDMPRDVHLGIERRLCTDWKADANAIDLTRVLRVPGFWHQKRTPWQVRLVSCDAAKRYSTDDLVTAFPPLAPVDHVGSATLRSHAPATAAAASDIAAMRDALAFLADKTIFEHDPDGVYPLCVDDRRTWISFGMALKREFGDAGFALWDDWSAHSEKYDPSDMQRRWNGFPLDAGSRTRGVTIGSIFGLAKRHGWIRPGANPFAALQAVAADPDFKSDDDLTALRWAQTVTHWTDDKIGELMQRMNAEHAFITDGPLYVSESRDGRTRRMSLRKMQELYSGTYPQGRGRTAFHTFNEWRGKRVRDGVGMYPGSDKHPPVVPTGFLNTWRGFAVTPRKGEWPLILAHLRDVICGGNEAHLLWLLDWFAQLVQEPQRKSGAAVVLYGAAKGTGKSTVSRIVRRFFHPHNTLAVSNLQHLVGNHNEHVEDAVFIAMEEATWGGSKQTEGILKEFITGETLLYNPKGLPAYSGPNYSRLLFTSNNDRPVHVDPQERRYLALHVAGPERGKAYFDALNAEIDNGGVEAFLYDLLERQITSNFYKPPETEGLQAIRVAGFDGLQRGWYSIAANCGLTDADGSVVTLSEVEPTTVAASAVRAALRLSSDAFEDRAFATRIGGQAKALGLSKGKDRHVGWTYTFAPMAAFRASVETLLGLPLGYFAASYGHTVPAQDGSLMPF